jgi:hypothetical protein
VNIVRQAGVGRGHDVSVAGHVVGGDDELVARGDGDRSGRDSSEPDFGSLQVDQHADAATGAVACLTHAGVRRFMVDVAAVAEIEPRDVQAGVDELPDGLRVRGCRAEGRDDLGSRHARNALITTGRDRRIGASGRISSYRAG